MPDKPAVAADDIEIVDIDSLVLDPHNARRGSIAKIVESIEEHGQHRPAVCRREDRTVTVGNHMIQAMLQLGYTQVVVWWKDDDETEATRRSLSDNMSGDQATWDVPGLKELLDSVGPDIAGGDDDLIARIMAETAADDPIDRPEYPIQARPGEEYDYILVWADNQIDKAWLETYFGTKVRGYKNTATKRTHMYGVSELQERIARMVADGALPEIEEADDAE
jgi:hypothetical protein